MNRNTANCSKSDGRLIKKSLNWFRNDENVCPMMLLTEFATVSSVPPWKNLT